MAERLFFVQHERHGIYIEHRLKPRFTWKWADRDGKRFESQQEAQKFIAEHMAAEDARQCVVVEKT